VLEAKVHSAKVMDFERGSRGYCGGQIHNFPASLTYGWTQVTEDKGKDWVQKTLRWSVDLVERPRKVAPKEVL
jgi:hypothetical protein